jgi:sugar phosphate isomerase/epimerase
MFTTLNAEDLSLEIDFWTTVDLAGEAGFEAVDLPMEELVSSPTKSMPEKVAEALTVAGVQAGGWWLPVEFREDVETYKDGLKILGHAARLAEGVGARWCNTWIWPFSDDLDYRSNLELHVRRLTPVAALLADHNCVLGLEFVGPKTMRVGHRYEFISTMRETLDLVEMIGQENVGLLLDCWQWYTSHGTAADLTSLGSGQITYVHLNDAPAGLDRDSQIDDQRTLPGATGVIDLQAFLDALVGLAFDGPVAVEPYNQAVNELEPRARVKVARESLGKAFREAGLNSTAGGHDT